MEGEKEKTNCLKIPLALGAVGRETYTPQQTRFAARRVITLKTQMNDDGKELGGVVFKNGAKIAERQPDWLGRCTIEGQAYSVALWEKESQRTGVPFMSMSFRKDWDDDDIDPNVRELYRIGEDLFRLGCWVHEAHSNRDPDRKLKKVLDALNQAHKALAKFAPPLNVISIPHDL